MDQRERYHLPANAVEHFKFLSGSGCDTIPGVDDAEQFRCVCSAMASIGVNRAQQDQVISSSADQ